ncbi:MAG: GHKL domain-containing protein [Bacteroidales bacterium]|jgi:hypothetical protein|nr:GHKL domain-containing protein [Bacteroidales bacterium]
MEVLNWVFFISASLGCIFSIIGCLVNVSDDDDGQGLGLNIFTFLSVGLIFYSTANLFNEKIVLIIFWILLGITLALSLYVTYKCFTRDDKEWSNISVSILLNAILGFCIYTSFNINTNHTVVGSEIVFNGYKSVLPIFDIILVFWIPLFILLFFYWKFKNRKEKQIIVESKVHHDNMMEEILERLYFMFREYYSYRKNNDSWYMFMDEAESLLQFSKIDDELKYRIIKNIRKLENRKINSKNISRETFRDILLYGYNNDSNDIYTSRIDNSEYLMENITERIQSIIKQELRVSNKGNTADLKDVIDGLSKIRDSLDNHQPQSYSHQQNFIREIFHCLMTPISQMDAALMNVEASILIKEPIVERNLKSIKAGIELSKSFLVAYRQLAFFAYNNQDEDRINIVDGINSAELLYQEVNKKEVEYEHINIPKTIDGYSSNFILAILLPLIENAICAAKDKSVLKIQFIEDSNEWLLKITNSTAISINKENLYKVGYSSKAGHTGTGLSIVRNLIANIENSSVNFDVIEGLVITTLIIPKNDK